MKALDETHAHLLTSLHTIIVNGASCHSSVWWQVKVGSSFPSQDTGTAPENINNYSYQFIHLLKAKHFYINQTPLLLFSHSVVSNSLQPHGLQHARLPCPSLSLGGCSNSCSLSWWCIQPAHPLLSPCLHALSLSQHQGLFQRVSSLHQVTKVLECQLPHQSSNKYSGLISFRIDWFDLPAAQGILKSLHHHHSKKGSILQCSTFFMVQLSHSYMTTGKTTALTIQTFVDFQKISACEASENSSDDKHPRWKQWLNHS